MNLAACPFLPTQPLTNTWYRAVQPQFLRLALNSAHTRNIASRYNPGNGQFESVYLAEDQLVALFEVQALLGSPYQGWVAQPRQNWSILSVNVGLQRVADLTVLASQRLLDTTAQELTGDWSANDIRTLRHSVSQPAAIPAPTQFLGMELFRVPDLEGFLTISARVPTHMSLVIFPTKLDPASWIEIRDEKGKVVRRIGARQRKRRRTASS